MKPTGLTYAKAGVTPQPFPYQMLHVFDLDTGQEVLDVEEVNTAEGWLVSFKRDASGAIYIDPDHLDEVARQRIQGRFEIRSKA